MMYGNHCMPYHSPIIWAPYGSPYLVGLPLTFSWNLPSATMSTSCSSCVDADADVADARLAARSRLPDTN